MKSRQIGSHRLDKAFDAFVTGSERILEKHRALRLIVQLEMYPIDCEIAAALFRPADELPTESGTGRLWGLLHRGHNRFISHYPFDRPPCLHAVEHATLTGDIVILQVEERDLGVPEW